MKGDALSIESGNAAVIWTNRPKAERERPEERGNVKIAL
jgi:hypothetical protein